MKKLEQNGITINYSASLEKLAINTINSLPNKTSEYLKLFSITKMEPIIINYFDNLDEFREFIYKLRGEKNSLPAYARGTYDKGMVNACINPEKQMNKIYTAAHEIFHILYMKKYFKRKFSK